MSEETENRLDPVAVAVLDFLNSASGNKPVSAEQVAKHISDAATKKGVHGDPNAWRRYFQAVKNQAFFLARSGKINIIRKGKVVAPEDLKGISGVWRMRLPVDESQA